MQHLERIKFVIALIFVGFVIIGTIFYYLLSLGILNVTGFNKFYYSWISSGNGPSNVPIFFGLLAIAASYLLSNVYKKDNWFAAAVGVAFTNGFYFHLFGLLIWYIYLQARYTNNGRERRIFKSELLTKNIVAYIEWIKYKFEKPVLNSEAYDFYKLNFNSEQKIKFRKNYHDFIAKFKTQFFELQISTVILLVVIAVFSGLDKFSRIAVASFFLNYLLCLLIVLFFSGFFFSVISYIYYMVSFNNFHRKLEKRILNSKDYNDFLTKNRDRYKY